MPRTALPSAFAIEFAARLSQIVTGLALRPDQLSSELGYANPSTVRAAMTGRCVLATDKLARLGDLTDADGQSPNLHWLLTGRGRAFHDPAASGDAVYLKPAERAALQTLMGAREPGAAMKRRSRSALK